MSIARWGPLLLLLASGCAPPVGTPRAEMAMSSQPGLVSPGRRISNLLDFESPQDLVFVATEPGPASLDSTLARSGSHCLLLPPRTTSLTIKTPALLQGRPFPADWTLLGGYVYVEAPAQLTMSYESAGRAALSRSLMLTPRAWTPIMLDLTTLGGGASGDVGTVKLTFSGNSPIRLDDFLLVDNHETVVQASSWSVRRKGLTYSIDAPGQFAFKLPTAQAQQGGWAAIEACESRVRFASSSPPGSATIYSDGRMYWGEEFRPASRDLRDAAEQSRQHASPAEVAIPEAMGRTNRASAGDANNDAYNETRGAYEIVATGSRLELTITPRTAILSRPVLEIAGLPPGPVRVTMEGRLVPGAIRLPGGELLIELPGQIEHATLVNVRVK